ncbi:MAG: elongation factor G [Phycisphaerae bacterium]|nr:elongation factor G [Phycisphaerae bacterium]
MPGTVGNIRNVVLTGHGGAGKTMLAEAMLQKAGAIQRMGSIDGKNTVSDFEDLEKERQHSIDSSVVHFDHKGVQVNVIDTPGYPDFIGQALIGLMGADVAAVVVSAAAGIEVNTRRMMAASAEVGLPRFVVINKIDAENLDLAGLVKGLQETFGKNLLPYNLPADSGSKVIPCLTGQGDTDFDDLESAKLALTEAIVESDEAMMERYLGGEEISAEETAKALKKAVLAGTLVPILFTSATNEIGVDLLMDFMVEACPSPAEAPARKLVSGEGEQAKEKELSADASGPLVGQVFKIYSDPRSNIKYSIIRLFSGTVRPDTSFQINEEKRGTRAGHLYRVKGQELADVSEMTAGQMFAVAKIEELQIGDVVQVGTPGRLPMPNVPVPMYSQAIEPKSRGDEQKISGALARLSEEDLTFKVTRDRQTNELVVSGIGDLHLRVILERMARRFKLEVSTKIPKIPYRETISAYAEGHYRHKKQTGGAGQFGEVYLKVEPMERNTGFEFLDEIFGGAIPGQYLPAIEKGVRDLMESGVVAGCPMQDVRVRVYDGKHHPVDSKEIAFRIAGKLAMKDAIAKAKPVLLEPVVNIEVTVPSQYVGDITGDLSGRRGRIGGQDVMPGGMTVIRAQVPLSEVAQYNSQLRSVTGGQGSYTMEFSHYEPVPPNIQQEIIKQYKPKEEEEE